MTLVSGPVSDRVGRARVILGSLGAFVVLTAATAGSWGASSFLTARLLTGLGASGIVPIGLALVGDLFPFAEGGRALGWLFGGMAAGIAVGSSAGALLEPVIGWRGLFVGTSGLATIVLVLLLAQKRLLGGRPTGEPSPLRKVASGYLSLLRKPRAQRTYASVLVNAVLHAGIFTWLGLFLRTRYHLGEIGIGLALLGYGVPGFLFGPVIGRLADRRGRARLIPAGLALGGACALALAVQPPLIVAALIVTALSLGYDLTQPLLGGIVTQLSTNRGQAMGFNVFTLFVGFGVGGLLFQVLLPAGFTTAFIVFGLGALLAAALALPAFAREIAATGTAEGAVS